MPQDNMPALQEIRERALQHFCQCRLSRGMPPGDEAGEAPAMIVDVHAHLDPEASIEDAWVSALSAVMARHQEEIEELAARHKAERKSLKEILDLDERKAMTIVLTRQHAADKVALKERQDAAMQEFIQGYPKPPDFEAWVREQERKIAEENQGEIEGSTHVPPKHQDIRDFRHEPIEHGVRFNRVSGKGSFSDFGRKITIDDWNDPATTLAALQHASEKWESFTIFGPPKYMKMCAVLAAEHGFKINNPEVQEIIAQIQHAKGLSKPKAGPTGPKM